MAAVTTTTASPHAVPLDRFERFGGSKLMPVAGLVGVVGLVLTAVGFFLNPAATLHSYLIGFAYWAGISIACIIMVAIFLTAKAKWITIIRRPMELIGASVPLFALLVLPIVALARVLYPWVAEGDPRIPAEMAHHLHHKHAYLNMPFFVARQVIYFAIFSFVALRILRLSRAQDEVGGLTHLERLRNFAPGTLPFLALAVTFASFDWLMTLTPLWQSTIFGVYYFAGSFLAAFAVLTIVTVRSIGPGLYGSYVTTHHLHNLGKLLLAFTAFWAYIGFSQFLLIWIANLPEEAPWYAIRIEGAYRPLSIFLFLGHFVLPFFTLLSRDIKLKPRAMAAMATYILFMHLVDLYWLVWPAYDSTGPSFHWTLVTAFVGVGGLAVATALFLARGRYTMAVRDPFITDALRYVQP